MSTLHEQVSEALITAVTEADGQRPELTDEDKVELAKLTGTLVALYAADLRHLAGNLHEWRQALLPYPGDVDRSRLDEAISRIKAHADALDVAS